MKKVDMAEAAEQLLAATDWLPALLMEAISAGETAEQLSKMRDTIVRTKFTEL